MQQILSKLFRARQGEWGPVLLLQLLVFLIIAVLLIVKPTASALFLSQYGAVGLPYAFLATAVLAAGISSGYAYALRRFSLLRVMQTSLSLLLVLLVGCGMMYRMTALQPTVAIVLYLWTAIFGVLAASQFWMMANFVFDIRQAKRLFGLVGAGAIAGGIVGGYLTNLLAREIGARNLIFLAAALLVPCIILTAIIWRRYVARNRSLVKRKQQTTKKFEPPHRMILASRHLLLLCGIVALSVTVAKLIDYQFSVLAAERYGDQDRLAAFFGFWYSTFNIVGLVIQLVATNRVVQRLGVSSALLFLPVGLGVGALAMLFVPGLGAAIFSRSVDGSLKQSLSRASIEMLFLPLEEETKKRVKTYIDVFIDSAAGGLGGLILIALTQFLGVSAPMISWFTLLLVAGWLVCVLLIREEYIDAFRAQLSHLQPKEHSNRLRSHHRKVMAGFLRVLEDDKMSAHEKQLLYVLERTGNLEDKAFREPIRQLLSHPSPTVRARALRSLYLQPGTELIEEVRPLLKDPQDVVRAAAFDYLFSRPDGTVQPILEPMLDIEDPRIAGTALVSMVTETSGNRVRRKRWKAGRRLRRRIRRLPSYEAEHRKKWYGYLLQASGRSNSPAGRAFIKGCLIKEEDQIVKEAIVAAGESQHEELIAPLLHLITEARFRPLVIAALVQYDAGLVTVIPELIRSGMLSLGEIRRLPAVLERIDSRASVTLLFELIERYEPADLELRMEVIRALNAIRRDYPNRSIPPKAIFRMIVNEAHRYEQLQEHLNVQNILTEVANSDEETQHRLYFATLLQQRMNGVFERMMRLIGLRYPAADIIPVHRGLRSEKRTEQLSALEFLDNLLEMSLKRLVIPLLERRQRQINAVSHNILPITTGMDVLRQQEFKRLRRILRGRDQRMKVAVVRLMGSLDDPRYLPVLTHYAFAESTTLRVRQAALEAMEKEVSDA